MDHLHVHVKRRKRSISKILSMKAIIFSMLGLCYIVIIVFSFTLQMLVISDMSTKMESDLTEVDIKASCISCEASAVNYSANVSYVPYKTDEKREYSSVDKWGNDINSNISRRQNVCSSYFQHNFNYVIQNEEICKLHLINQTIDLIVLIMTTHKNSKERMALRSTWLSHTKNNTNNVRYAFLLGEINDNKHKEVVLKENRVYHDLVKEGFFDTYMNLTYKTIMGFKWAATTCAHAHFVMKTDDDRFVNIPNILKIFKRPNSEKLQQGIIGACQETPYPNRDRESKWFASEVSYPEKSYPGFCSGTVYVTIMHVANKTYIISPSIPFFHIEDVYVSLCIKKLGLKVQSVSGFHADRPKMDPCLYKGETLKTAHQLTPVMLQSIWQGQCDKQYTYDTIKVKKIKDVVQSIAIFPHKPELFISIFHVEFRCRNQFL